MRYFTRLTAFCLVSTLVLELGSALVGTPLAGATNSLLAQSNSGSSNSGSNTGISTVQTPTTPAVDTPPTATSSRRTVVINSFVTQPAKTDSNDPPAAPQTTAQPTLPTSRVTGSIASAPQSTLDTTSDGSNKVVQTPISTEVPAQRPASDMATSSRRVRLPFRPNPFVEQLPATTMPLNLENSGPAIGVTPSASQLVPNATLNLVPLPPSETEVAQRSTTVVEPPLPALGEPVITQSLPPIVSPSNRLMAENSDNQTGVDGLNNNSLLPIAPIVSGRPVSTALTPIAPIVAGKNSSESPAGNSIETMREPVSVVEPNTSTVDESPDSEVTFRALSPMPTILVSPANTSRRRKLIDLHDFLVAPITNEGESLVLADLPKPELDPRPLVDLNQFLAEPAAAAVSALPQREAPRTLAVPKSTVPVPVTVRRESRPRPVLRTQDQSDDFQQRRDTYINELKRGMSPVPLRAAMDYNVTTVAPDHSFNYILHFDGFAVLPVHGYGVRSNNFGQLWDGKLSNWQSPNIRYQPLYFEQANLERYGVETRFPVAHSGVHFFTSAVMLPYQMGVNHPCDPVYPMGMDRPGNCTTPYGYRPTLNPRGLSFQSLFTVGAAFAL